MGPLFGAGRVQRWQSDASAAKARHRSWQPRMTGMWNLCCITGVACQTRGRQSLHRWQCCSGEWTIVKRCQSLVYKLMLHHSCTPSQGSLTNLHMWLLEGRVSSLHSARGSWLCRVCTLLFLVMLSSCQVSLKGNSPMFQCISFASLCDA